MQKQARQNNKCSKHISAVFNDFNTSTVPKNAPFSVSIVRQKSSSSDAETFRRPACWRSVKCQQKDRTHHFTICFRSWRKTCLILDRPRHVRWSRDWPAENWCVVTWRGMWKRFYFHFRKTCVLFRSLGLFRSWLTLTMSQSGDRLKQLEEIEKVRPM